MTYLDLVDKWGAPGFRGRELVQGGNPRKAMPPKAMWQRMEEVLVLANVLRMAVISRGATGLTVRAAYRPHGGAPKSAHKMNCALDLDLMPSDVTRCKAEGIDLRAAYAEEAVRVWCSIGAASRMGLGLYGPAGREWTWRVHLDTERHRTWQHSGSRVVRPPAAIAIAKRLGMEVTP